MVVFKTGRSRQPGGVMQRRKAYPRPSLKQGGELEATMDVVVVGGPVALSFTFYPGRASDIGASILPGVMTSI